MSELRADQIANRAGTGPVGLVGQSAAKAWITYRGAATATVRASFNISSVTSNGAGDYTYNMSNVFASANYSTSGLTDSGSGNDGNTSISQIAQGLLTAASSRVRHSYSSNSVAYDPIQTSWQAQGDLA